MSDVFLSYSRKNSDFARRLIDRLNRVFLLPMKGDYFLYFRFCNILDGMLLANVQ